MVKDITEYGKKIKMKLLEKNQTQGWLIAEVRQKTGKFFDSSYLHKIMVGKANAEWAVEAINEVLGI